MNYVFLSPHFPSNYKNFAIALKKEGVKVLGLGSEPYDNLEDTLKEALTEYYRVDNMEDYDQLVKACGYFTFKYGKIDRIESHNEYWLETDAKLRTDFNVEGFKIGDMPSIKMKSKMKEVFIRAGVPVAKGIIVTSIDVAETFIKEVGYPVCAKPDNGVGASNTYKISNPGELLYFFRTKPDMDYFMEEFITGEIHTFDGLVNKEGEVVFKNSFVFGKGVMETVNDGLDQFYHNQRTIPKDLEVYGLSAVKEFGLKERFFHIEFFRTKEGSLIALEVNVRPPGGLSLDMFNYASDIDVYNTYARLVSGKEIDTLVDIKYHCGYVGIKDNNSYALVNSKEEVREKFRDLIINSGPIASIFSAALGNYSYILRSEDLEKIKEASKFILTRS